LTNIRGGFASKLDELQVLLSDNNVDIAVITETWLNDDIDANILQIPGYMLFRLDRRDGRCGGGVTVYAKLDTPCSHQTQLTHHNLEIIWLLYRQNSMPREVWYSRV